MGLLGPMPFELNDGLIPGAGQKHPKALHMAKNLSISSNCLRTHFVNCTILFLPYKHLDVILRLDNFRDGV